MSILQEWFYRAFRIRYFSAIFIDADGTPRRFPLRTSMIKTGDPKLPPYFEYQGFANNVGRYYLDKANQTKHNGRMSQYYFPDNPFPIPIYTMAKNPEISAEALEKMYNDESLLDFQKIGKERKQKGTNNLRRLLLVVVVFIAMVAALAFYLRI